MKGNVLSIGLTSLLTLFLCLMISNTVLAGEVITPDHKVWAKKVLTDESGLTTISTSKSLAVLYFYNQTQQTALDPLQKGLTYMLITDLTKLNQIQLIERVRLQALLQEMDLSIAKLLDPSQKPKVGKLLKAQYVIGGQLLDMNNKEFKVESDLLDIPEKKILGNPSSNGKFDHLIRMEKELLFEIIKLLKIELSKEEINTLKKPLSGSIDALMAFFNGLEESDGGNYEKAADFYEKAITEDPEFKSAKNALKELRERKLVSNRKKSHLLLYSLRKKISITSSLEPSQPKTHRPPTSPSTSSVIIGWE